jgi:hypothetical protein
MTCVAQHFAFLSHKRIYFNLEMKATAIRSNSSDYWAPCNRRGVNPRRGRSTWPNRSILIVRSAVDTASVLQGLPASCATSQDGGIQ